MIRVGAEDQSVSDTGPKRMATKNWLENPRRAKLRPNLADTTAELGQEEGEVPIDASKEVEVGFSGGQAYFELNLGGRTFWRSPFESFSDTLK